MNQILAWLTGGDLRSDGLSDEAAAFVLQNPELFDDLFDGLDESDDIVRGRASDALEKVARARPDLMAGRIPTLIAVLRQEQVPMVKMHLAMILGHLAIYEESIESMTEVLLELLDDESVFAISWAIASLCIIGRLVPGERGRILAQVARLEGHPSVAVRTRVRKGMAVLMDEKAPFPKGWIKGEHLQHLESGR